MKVRVLKAILEDFDDNLEVVIPGDWGYSIDFECVKAQLGMGVYGENIEEVVVIR
jgi:hypothetical protein